MPRMRTFFDGREIEVMEPVRSIIGGGCGYSAADLCEAQATVRALGQVADRCGTASTCWWCRPRPRTTPSSRCGPTPSR
jgi:hypothetical protein